MSRRDLRWAIAIAIATCVAANTWMAHASEFADPTRPPETRVVRREQNLELPRLSGIYVSETRRYAVVDGRRVERGDLVAGHEVAAIQRDRVVLIGHEGRLELSLVPAVRQPLRRSPGGEP